MSVQVAFSYSLWQQTFPELATTPEVLADTYFQVVTSAIMDNTGVGGPVSNPATQTTLINYAIAHLVALFSPPGVTPDPLQPPGRISSATEGSVSANFDLGNQPAQAAWWNQTKYGALWWQISRQFLTMRYRPGPRRIFNYPFGVGGIPSPWGC